MFFIIGFSSANKARDLENIPSAIIFIACFKLCDKSTGTIKIGSQKLALFISK
jgi:hypothetical protein